MWSAWYLWLTQNTLASSLDVPLRFAILKSPAEATRARLFRTDSEREFEYLKFNRDVKDMAQNLAVYKVLTSICGTL